MQYLAEEYAKDDLLYPKNTKTRAIVNHRLCFNVSTYYKHICNHVVKYQTTNLQFTLSKSMYFRLRRFISK